MKRKWSCIGCSHTYAYWVHTVINSVTVYGNFAMNWRLRGYDRLCITYVPHPLHTSCATPSVHTSYAPPSPCAPPPTLCTCTPCAPPSVHTPHEPHPLYMQTMCRQSRCCHPLESCYFNHYITDQVIFWYDYNLNYYIIVTSRMESKIMIWGQVLCPIRRVPQNSSFSQSRCQNSGRH